MPLLGTDKPECRYGKLCFEPPATCKSLEAQQGRACCLAWVLFHRVPTPSDQPTALQANCSWNSFPHLTKPRGYLGRGNGTI